MAETYRVKVGGLMRCCCMSLDVEMEQRVQDGKPFGFEGETLPCVYHKKPEPVMIFKNGCWEWIGK